ncbi:MAG: FIST N-terminal domain-containing protein [Alphaproteobacteria bacterium]
MNAPVRLAHAADGPWDAMATAVVEQLGSLDPENTIGVVYASDHLAGQFAAIVALLKEKTGLRHWVGTLGYGVAVTAAEYYDRPALAAMAIPMPADNFRIVEPPEEGAEALEGHGAWIARQSPLLGLFHGGAGTPNLMQDLIALGETSGCFVVGGLTASRTQSLAVADRIAADALSGVLFAGGVPVATGIAQGCAPLGSMHRVTAADRNVVFELDGRPALKVLYEDLGVSDIIGLKAQADMLNAALPVENSDRSEYLVRNILAVDPDRGLIVLGDVMTNGGSLLFCRRDRAAAVTDMRAMLDELGGRLPGTPRAVVYVTCVARGPNLFGERSEEVSLIHEALGPVPLIGFFANGEIFNGRLHGYTGVITVFC